MVNGNRVLSNRFILKIRQGFGQPLMVVNQHVALNCCIVISGKVSTCHGLTP